MKEIYKFRVGVVNLSSGGSSSSFLGSFFGSSFGSSSSSLGSSGITHACFLIDRDLFEYGANKDKTYERHFDVGRVMRYDWNSVGNALNGTTYVSPDELEEVIIRSQRWGKNSYNPFNHNCHDFVQFCLRVVGCHESMAQKRWFCYRNQQSK